MFRNALIAAAVSAGVLSSVAFADNRPVVETRIPLGRGSFMITQLPPAPQEITAPYALTGTQTFTHIELRLGMRGQTTPVQVTTPVR